MVDDLGSYKKDAAMSASTLEVMQTASARCSCTQQRPGSNACQQEVCDIAEGSAELTRFKQRCRRWPSHEAGSRLQDAVRSIRIGLQPLLPLALGYNHTDSPRDSCEPASSASEALAGKKAATYMPLLSCLHPGKRCV